MIIICLTAACALCYNEYRIKYRFHIVYCSTDVAVMLPPWNKYSLFLFQIICFVSAISNMAEFFAQD